MTQEEKINLLTEYLTADYKLGKTIMLKNEAVKAQDFASALKYREEEKELRRQYLGVGEKLLLSSEPNVQVSDTTEAESSNADDPIK